MEISREERRRICRIDRVRRVQCYGIIVFEFLNKSLICSAVLTGLRDFVRFLSAGRTSPVLVFQLGRRNIFGFDFGYPEFSGKILTEIVRDVVPDLVELVLDTGSYVFRQILHLPGAYRIVVNAVYIRKGHRGFFFLRSLHRRHDIADALFFCFGKRRNGLPGNIGFHRSFQLKNGFQSPCHSDKKEYNEQ